MATRERLKICLLEGFGRLFPFPLLGIEHALHETHLVFEGRVGECLQVGFQVFLQRAVALLEARLQLPECRLHLRIGHCLLPPRALQTATQYAYYPQPCFNHNL